MNNPEITAGPSQARAGFAAVLGLPNAGKSTLVNALVGTKVSIVSRKVHTTRCRMLGVAMQDTAQIVLIDTPGIFAPKKALDRAMVGAAFAALDACDAVVHLVDAPRAKPALHNAPILEKLPAGKPVILALNKVDQLAKSSLLALAQEMNGAHDYAATFMISALKGVGVADLKAHLASVMPQGEWIFDPDQITDMPMRFMAAEITREKIYNQLHEELPYASYVETEQWEEFDNGSVKISQVIHVQRDTQKAIVLGKGGSRIREIGRASRLELEEFLGQSVHLKLLVKVSPDWSERPQHYRLLGLEGSQAL